MSIFSKRFVNHPNVNQAHPRGTAGRAVAAAEHSPVNFKPFKPSKRSPNKRPSKGTGYR